MPNIHIHTGDPDHVVAVVTWALGLNSHVSIHLDNGDADITMSGGPTADDLPSYDQTETAARAATTHPLVDEVIKAEQAQARATKRTANAKRIAEREKDLNVNTIGAVSCPHCYADRGLTCESPKGDSYSYSFVHTARRQAYNQMMTEQS